VYEQLLLAFPHAGDYGQTLVITTASLKGPRKLFPLLVRSGMQDDIDLLVGCQGRCGMVAVQADCNFIGDGQVDEVGALIRQAVR